MHNVDPALERALEPILRAVRSLSPADRRAWLYELRADAPALAAAIEKLLRDGAVTNPTTGNRKP
jgi:hypothetical protein